MCAIPVVRINYLKESNSQNTTCLEIDGIFLQLKLHVSAYTIRHRCGKGIDTEIF